MAIKIAQLLVGISADTKQLKKKLDQSKKDFTSFTSGIKKAGVALAAAFSVRTVITGITRTVSEIDKLTKSFRLLGIQIKDLGKLEVLSAEGSVGLNQVVIGLQRQVRRISEAARGTGESRGALSELGFDGGRLSALAALDPVSQLSAIAKAMEGVKTQADKVRLGFKLWDSEGVRPMLELMRGGEASFLAAAEAAKKLGLAITLEQTKNMEEFSTALARLGLAGKGALRTITIAIAPAAIKALQTLEKFGTSLRAQPDESTLLGSISKRIGDAIIRSPGGRAFGLSRKFGPSILPHERLANRPGLQRDIARIKAAQARDPASQPGGVVDRQRLARRINEPVIGAGKAGMNFALNAIQSVSAGMAEAVRLSAPFSRRNIMFGRFSRLLAENQASPTGRNILAPNRAIFGDTTSGFSAVRENLRTRVERANDKRDAILTRILEVLREARGEIQQAEIF